MKTTFQLAPIFADHMMFQAGKPIRLFGTCRKKQDIGVTFLDQVFQFQTTEETFCFDLPAFEVVPKPFAFHLTCGEETVTVSDCLIGEVFIASGQSNMQITIQEVDPVGLVANPLIRFYEVPKLPYENAHVEFPWLYASNPHWDVCTPDAAKRFSAIGYLVAQRLQTALHVPVGIISCNQGDTSVFSWIGREELEANPRLKGYLDFYRAEMSKYRSIAEYNEYFDRQLPRLMNFWGEIDKGRKAGLSADLANSEAWKVYPDPYIPMGPKHYNRPAGEFETMVATILPFASRGVLFYQGESDHQNAAMYGEAFQTMVGSWRAAFRDSNLPFVFVQIAGYAYPGTAEDSIPCVREAQQNAIDIQNKLFMVTALDLGEEQNIHPKDKTVLAQRLSAVVLDQIFHAGGTDSLSPAYSSHEVLGQKIILHTRYNPQNLVSRSGKNGGITVSHDGKHFFDAERVELVGNRLIIAIAAPIKEIRYGFLPYPMLDIYTENGLPLLPFRIRLER